MTLVKINFSTLFASSAYKESDNKWGKSIIQSKPGIILMLLTLGHTWGRGKLTTRPEISVRVLWDDWNQFHALLAMKHPSKCWIFLILIQTVEFCLSLRPRYRERGKLTTRQSAGNNRETPDPAKKRALGKAVIQMNASRSTRIRKPDSERCWLSRPELQIEIYVLHLGIRERWRYQGWFSIRTWAN